MDSGNSGSLQSSSGGDEEYDSRAADSLSAFIKPHGGPLSSSPPPLFDPLSNYLQPNYPNPWPRPASRPDPNHNTLINMNINMNMNMNMNNPILSSSPSFIPSFNPPPPSDNTNPNIHPPPPPLNHPPPPARNPKKRSRASRRAPTTVLTTDTNNFRAMVQEFTGIPAPPFNNSPFPRSRLDLFGSRSSTTLDAPPYLRRPFAQKVQSPPPFLSTSSILNSTVALHDSNNNNNNNNNNITTGSLSQTNTNSPAINYQLPVPQSSNLFNPLLNSLLQTNPKFPFSASPSSLMASSKPPFPNIPQHEFGLSTGNHASTALAALPNLISSDQVSARNDQENDNAGSWRNNGVGPDDDHEARMSGNYNNNNTRSGGKMNDGYMGSTSSGFHGERGPAESNVVTAARGEGMVESWICSSE